MRFFHRSFTIICLPQFKNTIGEKYQQNLQLAIRKSILFLNLKLLYFEINWCILVSLKSFIHSGLILYNVSQVQCSSISQLLTHQSSWGWRLWPIHCCIWTLRCYHFQRLLKWTANSSVVYSPVSPKQNTYWKIVEFNDN